MECCHIQTSTVPREKQRSKYIKYANLMVIFLGFKIEQINALEKSDLENAFMLL